MEQLNEKPRLADGARVALATKRAGRTDHSLHQIVRRVKPGNVELLIRQAAAAEERATANAAWHRERAGRYLAWIDLTWCAARFAEHVAAAEFQEAIAARHRAVRVALGEVRP